MRDGKSATEHEVVRRATTDYAISPEKVINRLSKMKFKTGIVSIVQL